MEVSLIIAGIDAQILKLTEARRILQGVSTPTAAAKAGRGRPKGSKNAATAAVVVAPAAPIARKRKLSPEGRKRIADAMKRRWAERRKTATKTAAK
ncbi:hypothetical protein [Granulicella arctica]|uniref:Uncharacterized protein n=1 Tax=Granulicella arctica TaxID=940613 RepID=A0A7Y9PJF2_9BACT|nr:hypothetical protein [Granulicella arctica]